MSSSGSDSGDEDYVPSDGDSQPPSEVESDGDEGSDVGEDNDNKKVKGKKINPKSEASRKNSESKEEKPEAVDIKQKSDSLWSDFLKDVSQDGNDKDESSSAKLVSKTEKQVITEFYEFAGEKVSVSKEVDIDIKKRKISSVLEDTGENSSKVNKIEDDQPNEKAEDASEVANSANDEPKRSSLGISAKSQAIKRPMMRYGCGGSNLGSALDKLGKKNKLSTLEKSKLDWESYKNKEGISDEISSFNKGKFGFLDKRDFLEKTDLKQYELEKQLRNSQRSKR